MKSLAPIAISAAVLLVPLATFAQTYPNITITTSPPSTSYYPGQQNVSFGTLTLTTPSGTSAQITSLPLFLTTGSGAAGADLQNCSFYNFNQTSFPLMTGSNVRSNLSSTNSNLFVFDYPLTVTNSPTTLTLRCNINGSALMNGTYAFSTGAPNFVTTATSNSAGLSADLTVFSTLIAGAANAPVAAVTFSVPWGGTANYNVTSIPLSAFYNGGLGSAYLNGCAWRNSPSTVVIGTSNGTIDPGSSLTNLPMAIYLPNTLTAPTSLILYCNVSPSAPIGGAITLSLDLNAIRATNTSTGGLVTPVPGSTNSSSGTATIFASAGGGTGTGTGGGLTTPNTGGGASVPYAVPLIALALITMMGGYALFMPRREEKGDVSAEATA